MKLYTVTAADGRTLYRGTLTGCNRHIVEQAPGLYTITAQDGRSWSWTPQVLRTACEFWNVPGEGEAAEYMAQAVAA